jgi:uncharacterized membrane protein
LHVYWLLPLLISCVPSFYQKALLHTLYTFSIVKYNHTCINMCLGLHLIYSLVSWSTYLWSPNLRYCFRICLKKARCIAHYLCPNLAKVFMDKLSWKLFYSLRPILLVAGLVFYSAVP